MTDPVPEPVTEEKVRRIARAALQQAYARAAKDPAFRREAGGITREFAAADNDGL